MTRLTDIAAEKLLQAYPEFKEMAQQAYPNGYRVSCEVESERHGRLHYFFSFEPRSDR